MKIGVSTACLYPLATEDAFSQLARLGIHEIEIFFNSQSELDPSFVSILKSTRDEYGIRIPAVHPFTSGFEPFLLFSHYLRRFEDTRALYRRFAEVAAELGAKILVLHGDSIGGLLSDEEYFERFALLAEDCRPYGVVVAQENVNRFRASSPAFITKMKRALPECAKFLLDIKQAVRSGFHPLDVMDAMGDGICHVHLSDHNPAHSCLLPGEGSFDFLQLFQRLQKLSYSGSYVVEVYRAQYDSPDELLSAAQYLSSTRSRIF